MYRDLKEVVAAAMNNDGPRNKLSDQKRWQSLHPVNQEYVRSHNLDKQLKFGRTVYIPYQKVLVISGECIGLDKNDNVNDTFIHCLATNTVQRMPNINVARTSFAAHYDFGDRYVYVIGGCNKNGRMITNCEKFDVLNQRWIVMPSLNMERGNPGTFVSQDRRYLYAFEGFKN